VHTARILLPLLLAAAGCRAGAPSDSIAVVDFIREVDLADRRPSSYAATSFTAGGRLLPAIVGPAPGRLTWTLPMPRRARFRAEVAAVGAPVRVRIGISDNRTYEGLGQATLDPSAPWTPIDVDLSAYAGWKPSLFYRPDRVRWHFVLSADAVAGIAGTLAWGRPEIDAAREEAREYLERRAQLTRNGAP
jgi:hypothetical protein